MFDRILAFLKELPAGEAGRRKASGAEDPRVAAAALMYHVMDADGVRQDTEWERMKKILAEAYGLAAKRWTSSLPPAARRTTRRSISTPSPACSSVTSTSRPAIEFIGLMWEIVFADGDLHELEDHTVWRIAELIGVDRRDRILERQKAQAEAPGSTGQSTED